MSLNLAVFVNQRWKCHSIFQELGLIFDFQLCVQINNVCVRDRTDLNKTILECAINLVKEKNSALDLKDDHTVIASRSTLLKYDLSHLWSGQITYSCLNINYKSIENIIRLNIDAGNANQSSETIKCITCNLDLIPLYQNTLFQFHLASKIPIDLENLNPVLDENSILWNDLDGAIFGYSLLLCNYCQDQDMIMNHTL